MHRKLDSCAIDRFKLGSSSSRRKVASDHILTRLLQAGPAPERRSCQYECPPTRCLVPPEICQITFGRSGQIKSQRSESPTASRLGQSLLSISLHFIMFALRPCFSISFAGAEQV